MTGAPVPSYLYEFTSAEFGRNDESQLEVTNGGLDRDPPHQPTLVVQVRRPGCTKAVKQKLRTALHIPKWKVSGNGQSWGVAWVRWQRWSRG